MSLSDVSRKCVMIARRTCSSFSFYFHFCSFFYFSFGSLHHLSHKSRHIKSSICIHLYFHCRLANICVMIIIWQTEFASYTRSTCATLRQWVRQSNTSHRAYARYHHINSFRRRINWNDFASVTTRMICSISSVWVEWRAALRVSNFIKFRCHAQSDFKRNILSEFTAAISEHSLWRLICCRVWQTKWLGRASWSTQSGQTQRRNFSYLDNVTCDHINSILANVSSEIGKKKKKKKAEVAHTDAVDWHWHMPFYPAKVYENRVVFPILQGSRAIYVINLKCVPRRSRFIFLLQKFPIKNLLKLKLHFIFTQFVSVSEMFGKFFETSNQNHLCTCTP